MKTLLIIFLLSCSICLAEENINTEFFIDDRADTSFITNPIYICPIHGEISGKANAFVVTIDGEDKYLCLECLSEFFYKNVTEVKVKE